MDSEIKFLCYEDDKGFEVYLEPEGMDYQVLPNTEIKFIARNVTNEFYWSFRCSNNNKVLGIQAFPDIANAYDSIDVYENGKLIY